MNADENPPDEVAARRRESHESNELVRVARERERVAAEREHIADERVELAEERERLAAKREHHTDALD
jgi:hypothetical protein